MKPIFKLTREQKEQVKELERRGFVPVCSSSSAWSKSPARGKDEIVRVASVSTPTRQVVWMVRSAEVLEAAKEFLARRDRRHHPAGERDNAKRFYPSAGERQSCCAAIRSPSRSFPFSYLTHCRSAEHVAHLFGVDLLLLKRVAKDLDQEAAGPGEE